MTFESINYENSNVYVDTIMIYHMSIKDQNKMTTNTVSTMLDKSWTREAGKYLVCLHRFQPFLSERSNKRASENQ